MKPAVVFISYSHHDAKFAELLRSHLTPLEREGLIGTWYDGMIAEGDDWSDEITSQLSTADIVILLISADFFASEYCYNKELSIALQRRSDGKAIVLPVIVRAVDWNVTPLGRIQVLPKNGKPVEQWEHPDEAWLQVALAVHTNVLRLTSFSVEHVDENGLKQISKGEPELEIGKFLQSRKIRELEINKIFASVDTLFNREKVDPDEMMAIMNKFTDANEEKMNILLEELELVQKIENLNKDLVAKGHLNKVTPLSTLGLKTSTELTWEIATGIDRWKRASNALTIKYLQQAARMIPIRTIR